MLLTLVPLLLAGVLTLEITVLIGLPLNFANIIALPLLLGLGVAFKIYFVMAWRGGQDEAAAIEPDARRVLQRHDDGRGVRQLWSSKHPGHVAAWANCWRCRWPARWSRRCSSSPP